MDVFVVGGGVGWARLHIDQEEVPVAVAQPEAVRPRDVQATIERHRALAAAAAAKAAEAAAKAQAKPKTKSKAGLSAHWGYNE